MNKDKYVITREVLELVTEALYDNRISECGDYNNDDVILACNRLESEIYEQDNEK